VAAIALGQLTLVFVNGFMAGMFKDILQTITGPLIGHVQIHQKDWKEERAVDLYIDGLAGVVSGIESLPSVESVSARIYAPALSASGEPTSEPADAEPAMIIGVDVKAESQKGGLLEGLTNGLLDEGTVFVCKVLANRLGLENGQQLALIGQDADGFPTSDLFTVEAIIESKVEVVQKLGVVLHLTDAGEFLALPDQAHEIVVQGHDFRDAEALADTVNTVAGLSDVEILPWRDAAPELAAILDMKWWTDLIFLAILFAAAAAGIANTSMMSTFERRNEFGMLLAVGSAPRRIVGMVLIESVILGLIGVAIGSILGSALVILTSYTGIDYAALGGAPAADFAYKGLSFSYVIYPAFEFRHIVFGLFAVTITSILASLWPAALTARLEPMEAMRA
jgi:ABC-type lipoprotein release transport system permease subunit